MAEGVADEAQETVFEGVEVEVVGDAFAEVAVDDAAGGGADGGEHGRTHLAADRSVAG